MACVDARWLAKAPDNPSANAKHDQNPIRSLKLANVLVPVPNIAMLLTPRFTLRLAKQVFNCSISEFDKPRRVVESAGVGKGAFLSHRL